MRRILLVVAAAFIGGNLAENAGGPRAVKWVTKDFVLNLEVVLPSGESHLDRREYPKKLDGI